MTTKVRCCVCGEYIELDTTYVWKYKDNYYCELCEEELIEQLEKEGELNSVECKYKQYYDSIGNYLCDDYEANANDILENLSKEGFFNQFN